MIKFTAPEDRVIKSRNGGDVVDNVVEVLALIKKTPNITTKQIASTLSIEERQAQRIIKKLKDANKLHRIGSDRAGYWEIIE